MTSAFTVTVVSEQAASVPEGAGAGLTSVLSEALERAALTAATGLSGQLWISDRWQAEILINGERKAEEAPFNLGHHLLARLAEFAASQSGGTLSDPVLRTFEDLATPSPAALLHYLAGRAAGGDARMRFWRRGFELDPALAALRTALARELLTTGNPGSAAALLQGIAVQDGFAAADIGIALWAAGEAQVSFDLLQAAVKSNPENGLAGAALATLLVRRAQAAGTAKGEEGHNAWDEALLLATQSTQQASDDFRTWTALAEVHRAGGDFDQAAFFYGFALRLEPDAPTVLKDASACWLQARQPAQALPLIERARAAAPADAENAGNLAFAHLLLGDQPAALAAAREAATLGPDNPRLHILHGELALKAGQRDEALDAWARAAVLEPGIFINPEGGNLGLESPPEAQ
ncbi:MAG: tetratricopeptide repeat protein [Terriglobales bacterium]